MSDSFWIKGKKGEQIKFDLKTLGRIDREHFKKNPKLLKIFNFFDAADEKDEKIKSGHNVLFELGNDCNINLNVDSNPLELGNLFNVFKQLASKGAGATDELSQEEAEMFVKDVLQDYTITADDIFEFLKIAHEEQRSLADITNPIQITPLPDGGYAVDTFYAEFNTHSREVYDSSGKFVHGFYPTYNSKNNNSAPNVSILHSNIPGINYEYRISPEHKEELQKFITKYYADIAEGNSKFLKDFLDNAGMFEKLAMLIYENKETLQNLQKSAEYDSASDYYDNSIIYNKIFDVNDDYETFKEKLKIVFNSNINLLEEIPPEQSKLDVQTQRYHLQNPNVTPAEMEHFRTLTFCYQYLTELKNKMALLDANINDPNAVLDPLQPGKHKLKEIEQGKEKFIKLYTLISGNADLAKTRAEEIFADIRPDADSMCKVRSKIKTELEKLRNESNLHKEFSQILMSPILKDSVMKIGGDQSISSEELDEEGSYKALKKAYRDQFRIIYGKDDPSTKIEDMIQETQELAGNTKLLTELIVAALLTRAIPLGSLSAFMQKAASVGIFYASNVSVSMINQATSKNGLSFEKAGEIILDEAQMLPILAFGTYAATPLAEYVGKIIQKSGLETTLLESVSSELARNGKATVSGKGILEFVQGNNKFFAEIAKFVTEIAAFGAFDIVTSGSSVFDALENNALMMFKMRLMGAASQTIAGNRILQQKMKKRINEAIKTSQVDQWKIEINKTPDGKITYSVKNEKGEPIKNAKNIEDVYSCIMNNVTKQIKFDDIAQNVFKQNDTTDGKTILTELLGDEANINNSEALKNLRIKKVPSENQNNEFEYEITTKDGKTYKCKNFDDVVNHCIREQSSELFSQKFDEKLSDGKSLSGKELFKLLFGEDNPNTERLSCLEKLSIRKIEKDGKTVYEISIGGNKIILNSKDDIINEVYKLIAPEFANNFVNDTFKNAKDGEVDFNELQKGLMDIGFGEIVDKKYCDGIKIKKSVDSNGKESFNISLSDKNLSLTFGTLDEAVMFIKCLAESKKAKTAEAEKAPKPTEEYNDETPIQKPQTLGINEQKFNEIKTTLNSIIKNQNTVLDKLNAINNYFHQNKSEIARLFNTDNTWADGCEKNSRLFKLLCDELGIEGVECKTGIYTDVYGREEEHMWCEVTVDHKTYIYDMAQRQVLPKGWSPNPNNPNCGYKEVKVTAPKSVKDKTTQTTMTDAEFATQGRELCRRADGTESPAARALLEAVKNSDLSNNSYDANDFELFFKGMTRDYQGNLYSEEILGYAKEIVESIPKGKDKYLIQGTDGSIGSIIMFQLKYAKPEAKRQIVDATKQLMSNPNVRNSIVYMIIKACTENDSKESCTFNQIAFLKIRDMLFNKTENHEYTNNFVYSLRVAEMAESSIKNGKFSDIYFEIAKLYDKTSSHIVHITFDQDFTSFGRKDLSFDKFDKPTQDVMKKMLIEKIKQDYRSDSYDILKIAKSGGWGPTDYNLPKLFACDYLMKNIDGLKPYLKTVVDSFSYDNLLNDLETFINNYKKLSETNICKNEHSKFYILSELKGLEIKDIMPFIRNKDFNKYDYLDLEKIFDLLRALKGMENSAYHSDRMRLFEITARILPNAELTQAFKEAGVDVVAEREKLMNTLVYKQATTESPANKSNFIGNILSNKIDITKLDSAELLKRIEEGIPEFANVKDKEKYVDMLKDIVNSPEFENLDNTSKSILKYTIITLPLNQDVTQSILKQYSLPDYLINRIKKLKEITNMTNLSDYLIDYQASYLQNGQSFDIFKLIVSKMTTINPEYKIPDLQKLDEKINQARQNTNILYPSKIINQSLIPTQNTNIGGNNIPIQYLDLSSIDTKTDLSKYGFNPGTTVENALLLLHMFNFDTGGVQPKFIDFKNAVDNPNSTGITASASAKKLLKNGTLFGDGVGLLIAGSENSSYPAASNGAFHSNLKKTDMTYSQWLFDSRRGANPEENTENWYHVKALSFLKDNFLAELKQNNIELTNEEYGILVSQLPRYKTAIKDITIRDKTISKDIIINVINATENALTETGELTEVLVNQPQIQAFVTTMSLEYISSRYPSLVLLSNQYNIPIIRI